MKILFIIVCLAGSALCFALIGASIAALRFEKWLHKEVSGAIGALKIIEARGLPDGEKIVLDTRIVSGILSMVERETMRGGKK